VAAAAEDGAHVGALAGLQQHDDAQEDARGDVDQRNDVADENLGHHFSSNRTMRMNCSATRLAPPTRAPSMSGSAIRLSMLSGFTLPPYTMRTRAAVRSSAIAASSLRIVRWTSCACAGVAVLPVPIAHTGSYATIDR